MSRVLACPTTGAGFRLSSGTRALITTTEHLVCDSCAMADIVPQSIAAADGVKAGMATSVAQLHAAGL